MLILHYFGWNIFELIFLKGLSSYSENKMHHKKGHHKTEETRVLGTVSILHCSFLKRLKSVSDDHLHWKILNIYASTPITFSWETESRTLHKQVSNYRNGKSEKIFQLRDIVGHPKIVIIWSKETRSKLVTEICNITKRKKNKTSWCLLRKNHGSVTKKENRNTMIL